MSEKLDELWDVIKSRDATILSLKQDLCELRVALDKKEKARQLQEIEINNLQLLVHNHFVAIRLSRVLCKLLPVLRPLAKNPRWLIDKIKPRLGNLYQYPPRRLSLPRKMVPVVDSVNYPAISIITPSFEQGRFIERTMLSVLDQQYPKLEYYVQDGGSKDGTVELLEKYSNRLLGWESKKDGGQSQAINLGFAHVKGEIMGWLNSDDLLMPGALAVVADYFSKHPAVDVVYGNRLLIDENDMEVGCWILPGHDSQVLSWGDYVPQETLFWRRRIWDKVGGHVDESYRFAMDWDLLVRFRDAGARFAHIPIFLGAFRVHKQQKTTAWLNDVGLEEMDRIRKRIFGRLPSQKEIRKAVFFFLLKHLWTHMNYRIRTGFADKISGAV